jgi:hypothetical protein
VNVFSCDEFQGSTYQDEFQLHASCLASEESSDCANSNSKTHQHGISSRAERAGEKEVGYLLYIPKPPNFDREHSSRFEGT